MICYFFEIEIVGTHVKEKKHIVSGCEMGKKK